MPSDCHSACACDCGVRVITPKETKKKFDALENEIRKLRSENCELKKELEKVGCIAEVVEELEKRKSKKPSRCR